MRTFALLLTLALGTVPFKLSSCGWDWNAEEYRFWLLQPELAGSRPLHAFYFTSSALNGPDYDEITQLPYSTNIAEWQAVVGTDVPAEPIAQILYGMDLVDYEKQLPELRRSNAFLLRLERMKGGWPAYITFAKRCEQLVNSEDPWGFIAHDGDGIRNAWGEGMKQLKVAKHPLLRARIAFQLVRLAHYAHDPERPDLDVRPVYAKYLAPLRGKTWLEPAAAFYLANLLNNPERDLAFASIFDSAPDKQFRMTQLFVSSAVENYLPLAKDDQQRATLLVMRDLQHPGRALGDLERIATFDPGNRHLPLLLTREVNKLEDWLLTPVLTEFDAATRPWQSPEEGVTQEQVMHADLEYLRQVQAFITGIAPQADADQRPLLTLLQGHLHLVAGDLDACRITMDLVERDPKAPALMRAQARLDKILCGVMASEKLTDATRADVLSVVQLVNVEPELAGERATLLGQLHLYLGKKLIERGELAEGLFLLARSERLYGTMVPSAYNKNARHVAFEKAAPADYDRMIALLDKPHKTPFEEYLTCTDHVPEGWRNTSETFKSNDLTREKLLDYKATWFLTRDRLEEAAATFEQIPDTFWTGYPYAEFADDDPFVANVEDPHNYGHTDAAHYTKRTTVERMIALKQEAQRDPRKRALNNYLLGNAYYNMSWHGKYWIMSRIAWSVWEMSEWRDRKVNAPGDDDYFGNKRAKERYIAAMQQAKDPVLKAMACRMAGECERDRLAYSGEGGLDEWVNPHLAALTDRKSLAAYKEIEECTGYADFVKRFK